MHRRLACLALTVIFAAAVALNPVARGIAQEPPATPSGLLLGPTPSADSLLLGPTPTAGSAYPGVSGTSYTSPTYGFSLTWDPAWTVVRATAEGGVDHLTLQSDSSIVSLTTLVGAVGGNGDAAQCLLAVGTGFIPQPNRDIALAAGADGRPLQGGDASRAYVIYTYLAVPALGEPQASVAYLDCRPLVPGEVSLVIIQLTGIETYNADVPRLEALLAGLVLPPAPLIAPTIGTRVAVSPTAPTPQPTAEAGDCEGVAEWLATTNQRIERVEELARELSLAQPDPAAGTTLYYEVAGELTQLAAAQRATAAPSAVAAVNEQLADHFADAADALQRTADAILAVDIPAFQAAQRDLSTIERDYGRTLGDIRRIAAGCGVD
jgi:hypothetical protein